MANGQTGKPATRKAANNYRSRSTLGRFLDPFTGMSTPISWMIQKKRESVRPCGRDSRDRPGGPTQLSYRRHRGNYHGLGCIIHIPMLLSRLENTDRCVLVDFNIIEDGVVGLPLSPSLTHTLSLSLCFSLRGDPCLPPLPPLSISSCSPPSLSFSPSHTHTLSVSGSLLCPLTRTHTWQAPYISEVAHTHIHAHAHTHTHTLSHTHTHSHTHSLSHTHTHLSLSHTHSHIAGAIHKRAGAQLRRRHPRPLSVSP